MQNNRPSLGKILDSSWGGRVDLLSPKSSCMLKHVFEYDYFIVQDFDEAIGFDHHRYKSLSEAILATQKNFGTNAINFMLPDTVVYHECFKSDKLNYSEMVISNAKHVLKEGFNMGKSIHSKDSCLFLFAHYCLISRRKEVFDKKVTKNLDLIKNTLTSRFQGDVLQMNTLKIGYEKTSLVSLHFKESKPGAGFEEMTDVCAPLNYVTTNWLDPISDNLKSRVKTALISMSIQ